MLARSLQRTFSFGVGRGDSSLALGGLGSRMTARSAIHADQLRSCCDWGDEVHVVGPLGARQNGLKQSPQSKREPIFPGSSVRSGDDRISLGPVPRVGR